MNKKIRLILIMGLTTIGLAFGLLYLTWGGDNESKLEKKPSLNQQMKTVSNHLMI